VESTIKTAQQLLAEESQLSPAVRTILGVLIMLVQIMAGRLNLSSRNSTSHPHQIVLAMAGKVIKGAPAKNPEVSRGASAPRWKRLIIPM
jgi:hypothetical protein